MKAIFNDRTIEVESFMADNQDRAFLYGDGLFETIHADYGKVKLLNYHWNRIVEGSRILKLLIPENFTLEYISGAIRKLVEINNTMNGARIKLMVWRKTGGKYEPENNKVNFLITCEPHTNNAGKIIKRCGFCESVWNSFSPWSSLKTISALQYVIAGIEKKEKNLDDIIILDREGNISEMLYSNIFWTKDELFYTPDLRTGCIKGVMRSYLIDKLQQRNITVLEVKSKKSLILDADHVFCTNAMGIVPVGCIDDRQFSVFPDLDNLYP